MSNADTYENEDEFDIDTWAELDASTEDATPNPEKVQNNTENMQGRINHSQLRMRSQAELIGVEF